MVKTDIAQRMHQEAGISEVEAGWILDWVLELFKSTLQQGEPISVSKFGVFTVRTKVARKGRNPRTGEELIITPRRVVTFHASPHLRAQVAGDRTQESAGVVPEEMADE